MARLIYSEQAVDDLERLTDLLLESDPVAAAATIDLIEEAVAILRRHPLIGRSVEAGLRELVISRGRSGYLALYSYEPAVEIVFVLAVHHQREAGYSAPEAE